jgi:hydroxypyruvate isomerase
MLKLSPNIEFMFADRDFVDRIDAVADIGLNSYEFGEWLHHDMPAIIERTQKYDLVHSNLAVDPRVRLTDEENIEPFVEGVRQTALMARQLRCKRLGVVINEVNWAPGKPWHEYQRESQQREVRQRQRVNVVNALKKAAPVAEGEGMLLTVECLNTLVDHADHYLASWEEGVSIINEVDSPAVRLTFDVYHHQINEGNIISSLTRHIDSIGHIHLGDVPGRHEPGTGEINFYNVLSSAKRAGYSGYLGLECIPSKSDVKEALAPIRNIIDQVNRGD